MSESCGDCKFYQKKNDTGGVCRYDPPKLKIIMTPQGSMSLSDFPPVQAGQWCGKWDEL